eukprot:scaffold113491_cov31-Cyclotella_meneghiniana.AAC.3
MPYTTSQHEQHPFVLRCSLAFVNTNIAPTAATYATLTGAYNDHHSTNNNMAAVIATDSNS